MIPISQLPNVELTDPDYPLGKLIDDVPNVIDGTDVNFSLLTDVKTFFEKLMTSAGITPNGLPDNETNTYQLIDALSNYIYQQVLTKLVNNLNETGTGMLLDASQGKVLNSMRADLNSRVAFDANNSLVREEIVGDSTTPMLDVLNKTTIAAFVTGGAVANDSVEIYKYSSSALCINNLFKIDGPYANHNVFHFVVTNSQLSLEPYLSGFVSKPYVQREIISSLDGNGNFVGKEFYRQHSPSVESRLISYDEKVLAGGRLIFGIDSGGFSSTIRLSGELVSSSSTSFTAGQTGISTGLSSVSLLGNAPYVSSCAIGNGSVTQENNEIRLGGINSLSYLKCRVALTVTSDSRDKFDVREVDTMTATQVIYGLKPIHYHLNERGNYWVPEKEDDFIKISERLAKTRDFVSVLEKRSIYEEENSDFEIHKKELQEVEIEFQKFKMPFDENSAIRFNDFDGYEKGDKKSRERHIGFSAQEVEELFEKNGLGKDFLNIVNDPSRSEGSKITREGAQLGICYERFIPLMVSTIQDQNRRILELEKKISDLEKK